MEDLIKEFYDILIKGFEINEKYSNIKFNVNKLIYDISKEGLKNLYIDVFNRIFILNNKYRFKIYTYLEFELIVYINNDETYFVITNKELYKTYVKILNIFISDSNIEFFNFKFF
uniref:Uncharacterized protein n=1 Tax=Pithovirus LCDPAC02 TaxID=2506601 RepID=A0A481YPB7_9VIRU|nr:MAG: hypothetical protein LCDPAC02_02910 [Pithovirus LCDPAC02]